MSFIPSPKGSKQNSNVHQTKVIWGNPKYPRGWLANSSLEIPTLARLGLRRKTGRCIVKTVEGGGKAYRKGRQTVISSSAELPRATRPRHAPARPLASRPHPPAGAARPLPPGRGCSGGRRPRAEAGERAAGPWRRRRPGVPGRRFPGTAVPRDRSRGPRAQSSRHHLRPLAPRPHPSRRCAPPRHPLAVEPRRSGPEASARPRGCTTGPQRRQGRGAGPPYLHFPPPGCVLPVMGRHLAC